MHHLETALQKASTAYTAINPQACSLLFCGYTSSKATKNFKTQLFSGIQLTKWRQEGSSSHLCLFYLLLVPRVSQEFYIGYFLLPPGNLWNPPQHSSGPHVSSSFSKPALLQRSSFLATSQTFHCTGKLKRFVHYIQREQLPSQTVLNFL